MLRPGPWHRGDRRHDAAYVRFVGASARLGAVLERNIREGRPMSGETKLEVPSITSPRPAAVDRDGLDKFSALVDLVDSGSKELSEIADDLMTRFNDALPKGRENLGKMKFHIETIEKRIATIDAFNKRMSNQ
jgi:hypothetical protein